MARVVVVGGGLAGLASAARLAKTGHRVTLVEAGRELGGALLPVRADEHGGPPGFSWDAAVSTVLLPAVLRDLFRKTGRPLEQELELVPEPVLREHRFEDGSRVVLEGGSRARQMEAMEGLKAGLGQRWQDYVDAAGDDWDVLRRHYFEVPWTPDALPPEAAERLDSRESLERRIKGALRDKRARQLAAYPAVLEGQDPRSTPGWTALTAYLEQTFGGWRLEGGLPTLATALGARLATRGVEVLLGTRAVDVVVREGRAVAVTIVTADDLPQDLDADHVVCAIDPRRLPVLAEAAARTMPALPPVISHLALRDDEPSDPLPDLPAEVVLHGDPLLVVRPTGRAPEGHRAWTILGRGRVAEPLPTALARAGLDVRSRILHSVDLSPRDLVEQWRGSPYGVLWEGRTTVRRRLGPQTPVPGVLAAGAHATPGAGLHAVGLSAALVAQTIGPA